MAVDLRALFAAKRKKWARDNVCQVIFHKLQSLMFARNAIAYLLAKANLGPTSVTIQTLDFSWSKFEHFTSSVLQGASKLLIVFHTNQLILFASWMCFKQIAHTYRYCCGSVLHQLFISTMNQFHGCGSSLNHVYFNKEAVLQLWQISASWVFQQGSSFYKSQKKVCIVRLNKINTLSTISRPSSSSVSRYCWNRGILWWKKGRIWGKYKSFWQNKAYYTER